MINTLNTAIRQEIAPLTLEMIHRGMNNFINRLHMSVVNESTMTTISFTKHIANKRYVIQVYIFKITLNAIYHVILFSTYNSGDYMSTLLFEHSTPYPTPASQQTYFSHLPPTLFHKNLKIIVLQCFISATTCTVLYTYLIYSYIFQLPIMLIQTPCF